MRLFVAAIAGTMLGLLALVSVSRADEQKVELKDLPKAVADAVKGKFPGAELVSASKETEDGKTLYEVSLKQAGQNIDIGLTPEGTFTEIEKEIASTTLPQAVKAALDARYPKATIKKTEDVTKFEGGKETKYFEAIVVTAANKTLEVKVSPEGKILEESEEEADDAK
jgi:hypothetical protein